MSKVFTLAKNTFIEMLHEKLFFVVVIVAVLLFGLSFLLGALSFDEQMKILADFGFLAIQLSSLGIALFSGSYLLSKEIEKQTCLLVLARPVSRDQFIVGKFLGVLILNTLLVLFLGLALALLLGIDGNQLISYLEICISLWLESTVILALVLWLSLVIRPVLALAFGFVIFLLGHWLGDLAFFAEKSKELVFINLIKVLHWIVPNFYRMNWKSSFYLKEGIAPSEFGWMLIHTGGWVLILILAANYFFRRKDIV
ncbi:ABC-2 family transporter protein [compost metagenome]